MINKPSNKILSDVAEYYSGKLSTYGETPLGVDWNGADGQHLRFEQLLKIVGVSQGFSINDLGCGYGALYDFLKSSFPVSSYIGCDVSETMIEAARRRHSSPEATFVVSDKPPEVADYGVASGIFNVRLGHTKDAWQQYLEKTLDLLDKTSRIGFAFNCLTSYSDREYMRDDLYYADPLALFDRCKRNYAKDVALLHDYGLYEFTILVRKRP